MFLILTCFLFNCPLTDAVFVQQIFVNVCSYKSFTITEHTPVPNMGNKPFSSCLQNLWNYTAGRNVFLVICCFLTCYHVLMPFSTHYILFLLSVCI